MVRRNHNDRHALEHMALLDQPLGNDAPEPERIAQAKSARGRQLRQCRRPLLDLD